jgi:hypothetical protein
MQICAVFTTVKRPADTWTGLRGSAEEVSVSLSMSYSPVSWMQEQLLVMNHVYGQSHCSLASHHQTLAPASYWQNMPTYWVGTRTRTYHPMSDLRLLLVVVLVLVFNRTPPLYVHSVLATVNQHPETSDTTITSYWYHITHQSHSNLISLSSLHHLHASTSTRHCHHPWRHTNWY